AQGPSHMNTGIARMKLGASLLRQRRFGEAQVETLAGYDIMVKQANPAVTFIQRARKDLVAEYDSLKQPEKAARFVAELADAAKDAARSGDRCQSLAEQPTGATLGDSDREPASPTEFEDDRGEIVVVFAIDRLAEMRAKTPCGVRQCAGRLVCRHVARGETQV